MHQDLYFQEAMSPKSPEASLSIENDIDNAVTAARVEKATGLLAELFSVSFQASNHISVIFCYRYRFTVLGSVADPDHFDAHPDPTSEKTGCGSDHALYKIL
jgi:hypothetical protein